MRIKKTLAFTLLLATSACATVSIPVKGIASNGSAWSGYFTLDEFQLSGDGVICSEKPTMGWGKVNTHSFSCDDGRTGTATTTRTSMSGGTGEVTFSDGSTAKLTYGS